jgi:hypothetical protein
MEFELLVWRASSDPSFGFEIIIENREFFCHIAEHSTRSRYKSKKNTHLEIVTSSCLLFPAMMIDDMLLSKIDTSSERKDE